MQISKNLKSHSKTLRKTVKDYNSAAQWMGHNKVQAENILSYVYLNQFELLCLSRYKILEKDWAKLLARIALQAYYKIKRSNKEVKQLNVEVQRLVTYIDSYHKNVEEALSTLQLMEPDLAHYMLRQCKYRKQQDLQHMDRLKIAGFITQNDHQDSCSHDKPLSDAGNTNSEEDEDAHKVIDRTFEALGCMD